jgi:hypothetical protein
LKRDIEIHKDVEKELAKRSHFCQKVIKKLKGEVTGLEERKRTELGESESKSQQVGGTDEEMINMLEQKLE